MWLVTNTKLVESGKGGSPSYRSECEWIKGSPQKTPNYKVLAPAKTSPGGLAGSAYTEWGRPCHAPGPLFFLLLPPRYPKKGA